MDADRVRELLKQKFHCSQILVQSGMDHLGLDDPALLRAVNGLAGGLGGCGRNCGALTGGVCMFGLFAGRGCENEKEDPELSQMISEYLEWFEQTYSSPDCDTIISGDPYNIPEICPDLIEAAADKAEQILCDYGYLPADGADEVTE
jgi:C_GCAxxG_C_C family probable redox protein